ncbi:MAG TPA: hypothetical protein VHG08_17800 [Longimicrobium sp.]|nr:hypothetical protein [Longimicrobium sp.]
MKTRMHRICTCALAAAALHTPAALRAQGAGGRPALLLPDPAAAATSVDDILRQGTAALVEQLEAATAPGLESSDAAPMERPCSEQATSPELRLAMRRRTALLDRLVWNREAHRIRRDLETPLPVCFPPGQERPNRDFQRVVNFNTGLLSTDRMRGGRYILSGYASRGEGQGRLGFLRADWVCRQSGSNLQRRLMVDPRPNESDDPQLARWVRYEVPGTAALARARTGTSTCPRTEP